MKPFLKFPGNKYRIVDKIKTILPEGRVLVEPFVGSGAVFLNTDYDEYFLNDTNSDLISLFILLKNDLNFIETCRKLFTNGNDSETYYRRRSEFNETTDLRRRASLFLYLNRHGYNGLIRYNQQGGYNVPFGSYASPYFPEKEMIEFHERAIKATFSCVDFRTSMQLTFRGDVVYCDPPFVPLSDTASFKSYTKDGFTYQDQLDLAKLAIELSNRGVPVLISNHDRPITRELYKDAQISSLQVQRNISCDSNNRNKVGELLALFRVV